MEDEEEDTWIGERYGLVELRSSCTEITDAACFTLERKCLEEHSTKWRVGNTRQEWPHISIIGRPHPDPSLDTVPLNQRHRRYIHDPAVSRQASKTIGRPDPSTSTVVWRFKIEVKAYAGWFPLVIPANGPASINMNGSACLSPFEYIVCFPPTLERMRAPAALNSTDGLANSIHQHHRVAYPFRNLRYIEGAHG
ncbi:hypothetical protein ALC57_08593 [Trachymyrmex cornetzi]|uniref:Uncharacterized protein n=1 Tax=Trachymyrmex cornetzi TaxID=471704 RepID=A0A151J6Z8_9HYME|nr:hypothetical protein ALC57_08593 [Trachymyrmex cornetzi]